MTRKLLAMFVLLSSTAQGENLIMSGDVTQLLIDSENYGHCMAAIAPYPSSQDARCGGRWVVFSCSGDFNSKSSGQSKYDTALAAFVIGKPVSVVVDTDRKHNGYCFARQIKLVN